MTMIVEKIYGGPGTGKTTALINRVQEELKQGREIQEIAYLGFTRAACNEALDRAKKIAEFQNKRYWFMTLHATCFKLMHRFGIFKRVINHKERQEFCKSVGLVLPEYSEEVLQGEVITPGTAFYAIENYLVNTMQGPEAWKYTPFAEDYGRSDYEQVFRKWITYKIMNDMIDFTDMLTTTRSLPCNIPTKVMFVDEFQDLSPLQLEIIRKFMVGKEKVFIAGDDDQALYRFQGAEPEIIIDFPADSTHILKQSYRCPEEIFSNALAFISSNQRREPKEIKPREGRGQIRILYKPSPRTIEALMEGKTYILLRTNVLVNLFCWLLISDGIPYRYLDRNKESILGWTEKKTKLVNKLIDMGFDEKEDYVNELKWTGKISKGYYSFLRGYIYRRDHIEPEEIKVFTGTIHSSKGKEADTVFLFDDVTTRVLLGMKTPQGMEDERRVWYVGMTRARENLNIVHEFFTDKPFVSSYRLPQQLGIEFRSSQETRRFRFLSSEEEEEY